MLFGYSGHELQRFKNLVFNVRLYGICYCSVNITTAVENSIEIYSIKTKFSKCCNSCPNNMKFSPQTNFISILGSTSAKYNR